MTTQNTKQTKPAKKVVKMPAPFDADILATRQAVARARYMSGHYDREAGQFVFPASERLIFTNIEGLQQACLEAGKAGRQFYSGPLVRAQPGLYTLDLLKAPDRLEAELLELDKKVEAEYLDELKQFQDQQAALLIEQQEQQWQREQAKADEAAKEARLAEWRTAAEAVLLKGAAQ